MLGSCQCIKAVPWLAGVNLLVRWSPTLPKSGQFHLHLGSQRWHFIQDALSVDPNRPRDNMIRPPVRCNRFLVLLAHPVLCDLNGKPLITCYSMARLHVAGSLVMAGNHHHRMAAVPTFQDQIGTHGEVGQHPSGSHAAIGKMNSIVYYG